MAPRKLTTRKDILISPTERFINSAQLNEVKQAWLTEIKVGVLNPIEDFFSTTPSHVSAREFAPFAAFFGVLGIVLAGAIGEAIALGPEQAILPAHSQLTHVLPSQPAPTVQPAGPGQN